MLTIKSLFLKAVQILQAIYALSLPQRIALSHAIKTALSKAKQAVKNALAKRND